jgi:hypothetical protein
MGNYKQVMVEGVPKKPITDPIVREIVGGRCDDDVVIHRGERRTTLVCGSDTMSRQWIDKILDLFTDCEMVSIDWDWPDIEIIVKANNVIVDKATFKAVS